MCRPTLHLLMLFPVTLPNRDLQHLVGTESTQYHGYRLKRRRSGAMTTAVKPGGPSREEFSERLLKGSVKKSYEPIVDIDWDAPLDPDKFYLPPRLVSLYGTPMWDEMTRAQRIELPRQELVNTLAAGIWVENILNQALLRQLMH